MADKETVNHPQERIDQLAKRIYGTELNGTVEALLATNTGLASYGLFIPGGLSVIVPDVDLTPADTAVKPWE